MSANAIKPRMLAREGKPAKHRAQPCQKLVLAFMNRDCPSEFYRIMDKSPQHFFLNFLGQIIHFIADVLPFVFFDFYSFVSSGKCTRISWLESDFINPILPLKYFLSNDKSFLTNIICAPTFSFKFLRRIYFIREIINYFGFVVINFLPNPPKLARSLHRLCIVCCQVMYPLLAFKSNQALHIDSGFEYLPEKFGCSADCLKLK